MRKLLIAAAFMAALLIGGPAPAREGPWCAVVNLGFGEAHWDCQYASIEACRPNVIAGNRGFCTQNPNWPGYYGRAEQPPPPPRHYRRRY